MNDLFSPFFIVHEKLPLMNNGEMDKFKSLVGAARRA